MALTDLTDRPFGLLTVKERVGTSKDKRPIWRCVCTCGGKKNVPSNRLLNGQTASCGCLRRGRANGYKNKPKAAPVAAKVEPMQRQEPVSAYAKRMQRKVF